MWIKLRVFNTNGNPDLVTVNIHQITHYQLGYDGRCSSVYLSVHKDGGQCFIQVAETPDEIGSKISSAIANRK